MDSEKALEQKVAMLELLVADMTQIVLCRDTEALFELIAKKVCDFLGRDAWVVDEGSDFYILKAYFDKNPAIKKHKHGVGDFADFEKVRAVLDEIAFSDDLCRRAPQYTIPLCNEEGSLAFFFISSIKQKTLPLTDNESLYTRALLEVFNIALQNKLNYKSAITDRKTGLFTFEYFQKRLKECVAFCKRHGSVAAILMFDLDHFKLFNDTYGHLLGDEALVSVAKVLSKSVRGEDCVCRFGGEEFLILLTECNPDFIFSVAERIRSNIANIDLIDHGRHLSITTSVGGVLIDGVALGEEEELLKLVDEALYRSKQNGRNCTTIL